MTSWERSRFGTFLYFVSAPFLRFSKAVAARAIFR